MTSILDQWPVSKNHIQQASNICVSIPIVDEKYKFFPSLDGAYFGESHLTLTTIDLRLYLYDTQGIRRNFTYLCN